MQKFLVKAMRFRFEDVQRLLTEGGIYSNPQTAGVVTRGVFVCKVDPMGHEPKQTWTLDLEQPLKPNNSLGFHGFLWPRPRNACFTEGCRKNCKARLTQKNLGLDYSKLDRSVAKGGDITYIDFRKDWSPYFKRKCSMPDGSMVETGGVQEFAELHGITVAQAQALMDQGGTLELEDGVLACQVINNQPTVARFNGKQYAKAKELMDAKGLHVMDALSEMALERPPC